jgi:WD40 repeat protein
VTEQRLSQLLRESPVPDASAAEERGWRVVSMAFERRTPAPRTSDRPRRLAIAVALAILVGVLVLTPAGAKVVDLVREIVHPGTKEAHPLTSLPAPGQLLVNSAQGPWVVDADGSQRLLGDYRDAAWSPHGYFIAVTGKDQLSAVEPNGDVRWSLNRAHPADPRWVTPSGYRIAYRTGRSMRVVGGDGQDDHLLARRVAPTAAAWDPVPLPETKMNPPGEGPFVLALARPDGSVEMMDDKGVMIWRSDSGPVPTQLDWSADGTRLVAMSREGLRVFDSNGKLVDTPQLPAGIHPTAGEFAPTGKSFAVTGTSVSSRGRRSTTFILDLSTDHPRPAQLLVNDPGAFDGLSWSPNGRWLLVGWRDADEWLFLRPNRPHDVKPAAKISRQFSPGSTQALAFPRPVGWCCTVSGAS